MSPELVALCQGAGHRPDKNGEVLVSFPNNRVHLVYFEEISPETVRIWGFVAKRTIVESLDGIAERSWQRNRTTRLVGFHIDHRSRLIGSARVPRIGLTPQELATYIEAVARECDRYEYLLTGEDRY